MASSCRDFSCARISNQAQLRNKFFGPTLTPPGTHRASVCNPWYCTWLQRTIYDDREHHDDDSYAYCG